MWRSQSDALGARCVFCIFPYFHAHLGSSARDLSKRPKWSTYVESKVIGVKSLCLEGLVDYSITPFLSAHKEPGTNFKLYTQI